jgi:RNA polymerase primary sigma factor
MKNLNLLAENVRSQSPSFAEREGTRSVFKNVTRVARRERSDEASPVADNGLRQISSLSQYLNEIGQIPRLSVSEEQSVGREARAGNEEARERMINGNLRLVAKIAHDFEGYGMPVSDLINEGNIGLMKAVERFDPDRGVRFSTYSAYWIKQSVKRCLSNQSRTVRIPIHMVEKIAKLNKVTQSFKEHFDHLPDENELASELEIDVSEVRTIQRAQTRSVSLDCPVEEGRLETLEDRLPDDSAPSPYAQLELQTSISRMCKMLDQLQERDSTILKERFGLQGIDPKTLEEVGQEFGVTRERIRQLQKEALVKLRNLMDDWVY